MCRIIGHNYLERLIEYKMMSRSAAYHMLARRMCKKIADTHFKKFNIDECIEAIRLLKKRFPFLMSSLNRMDFRQHMQLGKERFHKKYHTPKGEITHGS